MTRIRILLSAVAFLAASKAAAQSDKPQPCRVPEIPAELKCGTLTVYENRAARTGRLLHLNYIVLPSVSATPKSDPVISIYGGPGQTATEYAQAEWNSWYRESREVILFDQRGTSSEGPQSLNCDTSRPDISAQQILAPMFDSAAFVLCRDKLAKAADLSMYGTVNAVDDLDDLIRSLGYQKVNLVGGSYGSRVALVFIERHPESVRSTILRSLAPYSFRNPLFHAKSAQLALDKLLDECPKQAACGAAFPKIREELDSVLARLARSPRTVESQHPETGDPVTVRIGRDEFAEALRVLTYNPNGARAVPLAIHAAYEGDLSLFAGQGLGSNYGLRTMLRFGMLMSVNCSEDVSRITEADIVRETKGTFLGDSRVRQQKAACSIWPRSSDAGSSAPKSRQVPALLISGRFDPATPPVFGEEVAKSYLPNSRHIVLDVAGHSPRTQCSEAISKQFLDTLDVGKLDTSCLEREHLANFATKLKAS